MPEPALTLTWHERALDRFRQISDGEAEPRRLQLEDYKFSTGEQWDAKDKALRGSRPMLVNNRTNQYIKRLVNTIRAEAPSGQVQPVDSIDDPELAEDIDGLIRHIQTRSDADIAHMTAVDHMVRMGVGYWRIFPEVVDRTRNLQELRIKRLRNRFVVYMDVSAQDPSGSDARDVYIVEHLDRDAYLERYPEGKLASTLKMFMAAGDVPPQWMTSGGYQVAEVWRRVADPEADEGYHVEWAVINGIEILEGNEQKDGPRVYPIPWIPVIRCLGEEYDLNGVVDYRGVTRDARDPAKLANYMESATAEMIALAPKAPWVVAKESIEGFDEWDTANTKNWSKLSYHPYDRQGRPLPPPRRDAVEPPIQAMAVVAQRANNNLRAVLGEVDVDAAEVRPEQSGKAILARQRQGEQGNSHFRGNFGRALRQEIRVLLAWAPYIYDVPRQLRIRGRDDQPKTVLIHAGNPPAEVPEGVKVYDIKGLKFDVVISEGPAYQTLRQEAFDAISEVVKAVPQMIPTIGDLWFENMDVPMARQMAARMKKMLPPQLQEQDGTGKGGPPPVPPQVQQQMQQMGQMLDAMTKELQAKTAYIEQDAAKIQADQQKKAAEIAQKREEAQLEAQVEIEKAQIQADTEIRVTVLKLQAQREIARLNAVFGAADTAAHLQSAEQGAQDGRAHEMAMAGAERAHQGREAEKDREASVAMHGMGAVEE